VGQLQLSPTALDFGDLRTGEESRLFVIATNLGDEEIAIHRVAAELSPEVAKEPLQIRPSAITLAPGDSHPIHVRYRAFEPLELHGALVVETDAVRGGRVSIPITGSAHLPPAVAVSPLSISFGDVAYGSRATAIVTVSNLGGEELTLDRLVARKPFAVDPVSEPVAPGETTEIEISFAPESSGSFSDHLRLGTSDPARPSMAVILRGEASERGANAAIGVSAQSLEFGQVAVCEAAEQWFEIANRGSDPLRIASLTVSQGFEGPDRGFQVDPGTSYRFPISFAPDRSGELEGALQIHSNDPLAGALRVALRGTGAGGSDAAPCAGESRRIARSEAPGRVGFLGGGDDPGGIAGPADPSGVAPLDGPGALEPGQSAAEGQHSDEPAGPPAPVLEGSRYAIGSQQEQINDLHVDAITFDPNTRMLAIDGLYLPAAQFPLGEVFDVSPVSVSGFVNELGDFEAVLPLTFTNLDGTAIQVDLPVTTRVAEIVTREYVAPIEGQPLTLAGNVARFTLKGSTTPKGGAFDGMPIQFELRGQAVVKE
jgi:hypothetical protein